MFQVNTYKLEELLKTYQQLNNTSCAEEKEELTHKIMNIMLISMQEREHLEVAPDIKSQLLQDADLPLAELANAITTQRFIKANHDKSGFKDILTNIELFKEISYIKNLSEQNQIAIASLAVGRLKENANCRFSSYSDLKHFLNIAFIYLDKFSKDIYLDLAKHLNAMLRNVPAEEEDLAAEFKALCMPLIKQYEFDCTPHELIQSNYYHAKALEVGIQTIEKLLKNDQINQPITLLNFVENYCLDYLKPGFFLLRPSSRVIPTNCFTFTVSKMLKGKKLQSKRAEYENKKGKIIWKWANDDKEYGSLTELLKTWCPVGWKAKSAPALAQVESYVVDKYTD